MIPGLDCLGKWGTGSKHDDDDGGGGGGGGCGGGDDDDDNDDDNLETPFAVGFNILSQRSAGNN